ncbi:hypothetical protein F0562_034079 [Nyssa sinensis]|uniref:Serine-threonine/tyrosine-protein kinase catalytic domain-containing protein n=1 Tax=Nyssa sinensis TaxID=561372 RepID=A0A5J5AGZ6_9ASTE|nr:hypothetical protein F0562_034079 [Nyssa sinensis]
MAMGSFSMKNLIDEKSIGCVYQAQFDDVLDISGQHHPNVTELVGYGSEHGQHLVVYGLHKNGSQHDLQHLSDEDSKPLIWNTRVKIALRITRAST